MNNHENYKKAFDTLQTDAEIHLNRTTIRHNRTTRIMRHVGYAAACLVMLFAASNGICYAATGKSLSTVKRMMKSLQDKNHIRRENGKRYGKWEVLEGKAHKGN